MRKILICAILATFGFAGCTQQTPQQTARTENSKPQLNVDKSQIISLMYDDDMLRAAKAAVEASDPEIMPIFNKLKRHVDSEYMTIKPVSIVEGKLNTAPSRDPRDWTTQSAYWWADPEDPTGPYIRFDGERNPETNNYPERTMGTLLARITPAIGLMYYLTGDEKYAIKVADFLRHFFLDPITGMNPNLTFAQYVPGMDRIRGTGINDGLRIIGILNAAQIISDSEAWTEKDEAALKDWAKAFAYWLEWSSQGIAEAMSLNNHGTSYESTLETVHLYAGNYDRLEQLIYERQLPRFPLVITEDSTSLHELARTKGVDYSTALVEGAFQTALVGEKIGFDDIWAYVGENGRSIMMNVDFMIPYWKAPLTWPYMQIEPYDSYLAVPILSHVGKKLGQQKYIDAAREVMINSNAEFPEAEPLPVDVIYYKLLK